MKRIFLLLIFLFSFSIVDAQYRTYKDNYDPKSWSSSDTDRYNPAVAGVFGIIPGLGQVYAGEPLRGLAFVVGIAGSASLALFGVMLALADMETLGVVTFFSGAGALLYFYIRSISDAVVV